MGYDVVGTNGSVGAQAAEQPRDSQATEPKPGDKTAKGIKGYEQPGQAAEKHTNPKVDPPRPTV
jgi:hypothetical protein